MVLSAPPGLFVSFAGHEKALRAGRAGESGRVFSARASAFRAFLPKGTAHSQRAGAAERGHGDTIVIHRRFVNGLSLWALALEFCRAFPAFERGQCPYSWPRRESWHEAA